MTVQNFDHFVDDDDFAPVELHDFDRSDMPGEPAGYTAPSEHFLDDDDYAPVPDSDRSDMPNTREPSPEPLHNVDCYNVNQEHSMLNNFAEAFRALARDGSMPVTRPLERPGRATPLPFHAADRQDAVPGRQPDWREASRKRASHAPAHRSPPLPSTPPTATPEVAMVNMGNMVNVVNVGPMSNSGFMYIPVRRMLMPAQMPSGTPTPNMDPSLTQPVPAMSNATPTTPAPEPKAEGAAAHSTSRSDIGKSNPGPARKTGKQPPAGDRNPGKPPGADRKAAACRRIYEHMLQRGMTSADGYLVADVLQEVRGLLDGAPDSRRTVENAFCSLLRAAPELFRVFRMTLQVAPRCGSYSRRGERMVRLILEKEA